MAIEYTLHLDSDASTLDLHEIICACIGEDSGALRTGVLAFSGNGIQGTVYVPDDVTRRFIREDFSFDVRVQIGLRLDKFELERAQKTLVRCISEIIRADDGDMMLSFNGDLVVLRRTAGDLVLREGFGVWTAERLALLETPYRVGSV